MSNVENLISLILKTGLRTYRIKNSNHNTINHTEDTNKKGVVFGFKSKEHMKRSEGFVMSSKEAVLDNLGYLSHWTPNIFSWGGYTDDSKKYVRGFDEKNLIQENCFVLDVDCGAFSKFRTDYLLVKCMENTDLVPTAIVETPQGYHLYFVLESPSYVSKANNYKSLETAKRISQNLRESFSDVLPGVDVMCNHFGIFRMPTEETLVHFDKKLTYDFEDLMTWSMAYSKEKNKGITFKLATKKKAESTKQIDAAWFKKLLTTQEIKGATGQMGRNNALFTASLACYSSGMDQEACEDLMDEFNSNLITPLPHRDVLKIIRSAYSGKYKGAHTDKISELMELHVGNKAFKPLSETGRVPAEYWVKHAKPRDERKRVHFTEWKKDLLDYINANTSWYKPYLDVPREKLLQELKMPLSTFKALVRQLTKEASLYVETKRGKGGFTKLATKKSMAVTLLQKRHDLFTHYKSVLERYFPNARSYITTLANLKHDELRARECGPLFGGEP